MRVFRNHEIEDALENTQATIAPSFRPRLDRRRIARRIRPRRTWPPEHRLPSHQRPSLPVGLGAILGGWHIYTGIRRLGGIITLLAGIILFVLTGGAGTAVLLVIVAGVLGLVAAEMKPWWAFWR